MKKVLKELSRNGFHFLSELFECAVVMVFAILILSWVFGDCYGLFNSARLSCIGHLWSLW